MVGVFFIEKFESDNESVMGPGQKLTKHAGGGTLLHRALESAWPRVGMAKKATPARRERMADFMMMGKS